MKQGTHRSTKPAVSPRERDLIHAAQAVAFRDLILLIRDRNIASGRTLHEFRSMLLAVLKEDRRQALQCRDFDCLVMRKLRGLRGRPRADTGVSAELRRFIARQRSETSAVRSQEWLRAHGYKLPLNRVSARLDALVREGTLRRIGRSRFIRVGGGDR